MFQKGFSTILIIVIALVVIAGGVLTWQYWPQDSIGGDINNKQEPEIIVIFPNGGEVLTAGEPQTIRWQSKVNKLSPSADATVNIFLQKESATILPQEVFGRLNQFGVPVNNGEFVWDGSRYFIETQSGGRTEHKVENGEDYTIKLIYVWDTESQPVKSVEDLSDDYFTIAEIDEIANWQTYRNEEYGFEVKHPEEWRFIEYPAIKSVGFGENPAPEGSDGWGSSIGCRMISKDKDQEITKAMAQLEDVTKEDITIDGVAAVKISGLYKKTGPIDFYVGWKTVRVLIFSEPFSCGIYFNEQFKNDIDSLDIFNQMLPTFRLLNE